MLIKILALLSVAAVSRAQLKLYCLWPYSGLLCRNNDHVACLDYFTWFEWCPPGAKTFDLTPLIPYITNRFNTYRNTIAGGHLPGFRPAARLPTLTWDNDLAYFAQCNTRTCVVQHSTCRKSPRFPYAGENIGWGKGYDNITQAVVDNIGDWWDEYKLASQADIDSYKQTKATIGHFTVMVLERSDRFGCGCTTFDDQMFIDCIFSYTNVGSRRIYKASDVPASECETGTNPKYPNLCSVDEKIVSNILV